mgnify:CR=1 FL=1
MTKDLQSILQKAQDLGLEAYLLDVSDIPVESRTRLKCAYGCSGYGKRLSCPPHVMSVDEFRQILKEYSTAILLIEEFDTSGVEDIIKAWSGIRKGSFRKMFDLEYYAFREGFTFAQLLRPGACNECEVCGEKCMRPDRRRFPPEAVGINLEKVLSMAGTELRFCNPDRVKCVGILLIE